MATADDYAKWIVENAAKKGTPEFDTVVAAYQEAKQEEEFRYQPLQLPEPAKEQAGFWSSFSEEATKPFRLAPELAAYATKQDKESAEALAKAAESKYDTSEFVSPTSLSAIGQDITALKQSLGSSLGAMAAPIAASFTPAGPIGGYAAFTAEYTANNLIRQAQEGLTDDDMSIGNALAAGAGEAVLDIVPFHILGKYVKNVPGVRNLLIGSEEAAATEANNIVKAFKDGTLEVGETTTKYPSFGREFGKATLATAASEVPTEVAQQVLERWQAGLPLDDEEAKHEYIQSAVGAATMAPLFGGLGAGAKYIADKATTEEAPPSPTEIAEPSVTEPAEEMLVTEPATAEVAPEAAPETTPTTAEAKPTIEQIFTDTLTNNKVASRRDISRAVKAVYPDMPRKDIQTSITTIYNNLKSQGKADIVDGKITLLSGAKNVNARPTTGEAISAPDRGGAKVPVQRGLTEGPVIKGTTPKRVVSAGQVTEAAVKGTAPKQNALATTPDYTPFKGEKNVTHTFRTERGSTYAQFDNGTTIRNRSGAKHTDTTTGLQPRSGRTIYMDESGASKVGGWLQNPDVATQLIPELDAEGKATGNVQVKLLEDYGPKKTGSVVATAPYTTTPEVGKLPVEIWQSKSQQGDTGKGVHFGNKIVEVSTTKGTAPKQNALAARKAALAPIVGELKQAQTAATEAEAKKVEGYYDEQQAAQAKVEQEAQQRLRKEQIAAPLRQAKEEADALESAYEQGTESRKLSAQALNIISNNEDKKSIERELKVVKPDITVPAINRVYDGLLARRLIEPTEKGYAVTGIGKKYIAKIEAVPTDNTDTAALKVIADGGLRKDVTQNLRAINPKISQVEIDDTLERLRNTGRAKLVDGKHVITEEGFKHLYRANEKFQQAQGEGMAWTIPSDEKTSAVEAKKARKESEQRASEKSELGVLRRRKELTKEEQARKTELEAKETKLASEEAARQAEAKKAYLKETKGVVAAESLTEKQREKLVKQREKEEAAAAEKAPEVERDRLWFEHDERIRRQLAQNEGVITSGPVYERRGTKVEKGVAKDKAQSVVDSTTSGWKNAPKINVVESTKELPEQFKDKVSDQTKGFYDPKTGTVHVVSAAHADESDVKATVFHESLGHYGLHQLFGRKLDEALTDMYKTNNALRDMANKWLESNPDTYTGEDKNARAVEEVLASASEAGPIKAPAIRAAFNRVAALIRKFIRAMGIQLEYSNADISQIINTLKEAHEGVIEGRAAAELTEKPATIGKEPDALVTFKRIQKSQWMGTGFGKMPGSHELTVDGKDTGFIISGARSGGYSVYDPSGKKIQLSSSFELAKEAAKEHYYNTFEGVIEGSVQDIAIRYRQAAAPNVNTRESANAYQQLLASVLEKRGDNPTVAATIRALSNVPNSLFAAWNRASTMYSLVRVYKDIAPRVVDFADRLSKMSRAKFNMLTDFEKKYNGFKKIMSQYPPHIKTKFNDFISELGLTQAKVFSREEDGDIYTENKEVEQFVNKVKANNSYASLSAEQKELYDVASMYYSLPTEVRKVARDMLSYYRILGNNGFRHTINRILASITDKQSRTNLLEKVNKNRLEYYTPFRRSGKFKLRFLTPDGEEVVKQYKSEAERYAAKVKFKAQGNTNFVESVLSERDLDAKGAPTGLVSEIIKSIRESKKLSEEQLSRMSDAQVEAYNRQTEETVEAVFNGFLEFMPNKIRSEAKGRKITRRDDGTVIHGVRGFEEDALQVFHEYVPNVIYQLNNLNFATDLEEDYNQIEKELVAESQKEGGKVTEKQVRDIMSDLAGRIRFAKHPKYGSWVQPITTANYYWSIAGNISSAIINTTVLPMMVLPSLATKYKSYAKATDAMTTATKMYSVMRRLEKSEGKDIEQFKKEVADLAKEAGVSVDQLVDFYKFLDERSSAGVAALQEIRLQEATTDAEKLMGKINLGLSKVFRETEQFNRGVTHLAAFLMKMNSLENSQMTADEKFEASAREAFIFNGEMNSNATPEMGASIFQSNLGRVLGVFRGFTLNMLMQIARAYKNAFAGETPEIKSYARRQLLGIYGLAFMFAGIKGMPGFGAAEWLAALLMGDDDEPYDLQQEILKSLGDIGLNGPLGHSLNINLADRTGLYGALWRDDPKRLAEVGYLDYAFETALGPTYGLAKNLGRAKDYWGQGNYERAFEAGLPSFARNALKASRFVMDGAKTPDGAKLVDDPNAYNVVMQVAGFAPQDLALQQSQNAAKYAISDKISNRRTALLANLYTARKAGDTEAINDAYKAIAKFNRANPRKGTVIDNDTIKSSFKQRVTREKQTVDGVYLPRSRWAGIAPYIADTEED